MDYYQGLQWVVHGHSAQCRAWVDKAFDGYYVVNYAHSGELLFSVDGQDPMTLRGPVVWLTYPGPRFQFGIEQRKFFWDHRFVGFMGSRVGKYIKSKLLPLGVHPPVFTIENPKTFKTTFDLLLAQLDTNKVNNNRAVYLLEGLMLQFHEQHVTEASSFLEQAMKALMRDIKSKPQMSWDFQRESEKLELSYSHFRRLFRQASGQAPNHFLIQARLDAAALLLRKTNRGIKSIAREVGIEDIYYFSKLFKKYYHLSPGKYRTELQVIQET